jgi:hypothetical protein
MEIDKDCLAILQQAIRCCPDENQDAAWAFAAEEWQRAEYGTVAHAGNVATRIL